MKGLWVLNGGVPRALTVTAAALLLVSGLFVAVEQLSRISKSGSDGSEGSLQNETLPDLALSSEDIIFSNEKPIEGESIVITAIVYNIGNADAYEVVVGFKDYFDGTWKFIGHDIIPHIPPGGHGNASVKWIAYPAGKHVIWVKADLEDHIKEWNENNNAAEKVIYVSPKGLGNLPDLTLTSRDIIFSNEHPKDGETIKICAEIHNVGNADAYHVYVWFWDSYDRVEVKIGETFIKYIPAGKAVETCIEWKASPAGLHTIYVHVDPQDNIEESNEANNIANREIYVVEEYTIHVSAYTFDNDKNGNYDDVAIFVYDSNDHMVEGAWVYIDDIFYGRTPDSGTLFFYNFSQGYHHVTVYYGPHISDTTFYSEG